MNTKLKCLLLDDELPGLAYLKMLCEQMPDLEVVKTFNSAERFVAEFAGLDFDLCILDIEMPAVNGLQIARLLKDKPVIFVTAYTEHAAEAFDLDAIDYVRKPVKMERLQQAVAKAKRSLHPKEESRPFAQLNTGKGKALIYFEQLSYIKASDVDSRDKLAQLADGTVITLKNISFEKLQQLLPADDFVRVNKKEIVALRAVQTFSANEIVTTIPDASGQRRKLALSEVYRTDFIRKVRL